MIGDPKPERTRGNAAIRERDPQAVKLAALADRECASCGRDGANGHHVLPKGSPWFGDDCVENTVNLCGSGTMGCHGAYHGSPYVDEHGVRWTQAVVAGAIGDTLKLRRTDVIGYVLGKLGNVAGSMYLKRNYGLAGL